MRILQVISDPKFLVRDRVGFARAVKKYRENSIKILRLSNKKVIYNIGYRYGLQLSVIVAFLMASLVSIILIAKYF